MSSQYGIVNLKNLEQKVCEEADARSWEFNKTLGIALDMFANARLSSLESAILCYSD